MPEFTYKAQNENGRTIRGTAVAMDSAQLQKQLREEQSLLLLSAEEKRAGGRGLKRLKEKQLAEFSRQISTLIGSGISLVRALSIISQQETLKPYEATIYQQVLRLVRQGIPLSDAMESMEGAFPDLIVNMYRSAEAAGNLDKVSLRMAVHYDKQWRLNKKVGSAMTYPKFLCVMLVGVVAIVMGFVLPQFEDLFSQMETLPLPTRIMIAISDFFVEDWLWIVILVPLGWLVFHFISHIPSVRIQLDKAKLHIPLLGSLNKIVVTARFSRALASLYASGIPILTCLSIAQHTLGNTYVESQFDQVMTRVKAGENLSDALSDVDGFVKKLEFSIRVGEETGALENMLDSIADSLEFESEMAINQMVGYLEPAMIIVMGVLVAFVMFAVLVPIYSSYQVIGGEY